MWGFAGCFFMIFRGDSVDPESDQFSTMALSLCE